MDIAIEFFRDTLDGPFYIIWVVVLVILIFACIGYLAEKGINNKREKEKYATVSEENINNESVRVEEPVQASVNTAVVQANADNVPTYNEASVTNASLNTTNTVNAEGNTVTNNVSPVLDVSVTPGVATSTPSALGSPVQEVVPATNVATQNVNNANNKS